MRSINPSAAGRAASACVDAALAADLKHGPHSDRPCAHAAAVFRAVHAAVALAAMNGVSRRRIEARCGLGQRVLDDMMSGKTRTLGIDALGAMLLDPSVLGDEAHALLRTRLLIEMGVVAVDAARPACDDLNLETLDVMDTAGALAQRVRDAQHPDSPGGAAITRVERAAIGGAAGVVMSETAQLVAGRDAHHE